MTNKQLMQRMRESHNWFMFSRDFLMIMSLEAAVVLGHLYNVRAMEAAAERTSNDWFRVPTTGIAKSLHLTSKQQWRVFNELEEKGYIKRRMYGNPAKRWMRICVDKVESDVEVAYRKNHRL